MLLRASSRYFERGIFMKKKYVNFTAALAAAFLCSGTGSVLAAEELTITTKEEFTEHQTGGTPRSGNIELSGSGNQLTIRPEEGESISGNTLSGGTGNANTLIIDGGSFTSGSGASRDENGTLSGNQVVMNGGTVKSISGAKGTDGQITVTGNQVTLSGGSASSVYGGWRTRGTGDITENGVSVSGGEVTFSSYGHIYGGYLNGSEGEGDVDRNWVNISGDVTDVYTAYGGFNTGKSGNADENKVVLTDASGVAQIYGGSRYVSSSYIEAQGNVTGNYVEIVNSDVGSKMYAAVYGGYSDNLDADIIGNTVEVIGGTIGEKVSSGYGAGVYGGYRTDESGSVTGNQVTLSGATSYVSAYGGYSTNTDSGNVEGNSITVSGAEFQSSGNKAADIYGGYGKYNRVEGASQDVRNNSVYIEQQTTVNGNVYGGYSDGGSGAVAGNTVQVSDGEIIKVSKTQTIIDSSGIHKVTVSNALYGGYTTTDGDVTGNLVELSGGTIGTDVYGGYSTKTGNVSGNTVALRGSADVTASNLYGRNDASTGSGNTLFIDDWSGSAQSVKNFETIRFNHVNWENGQTILNLTAGEENDLKDTEVDTGNLVIYGSTPQVGESMTFVKSTTADTGLSAEQAAGGFSYQVATSGTAVWEDSEAASGSALNYRITGVFRNPQTDLIAENRAVAAAFVNQGADIAADSLRLLDDGYHYGTQTFGAVYGNRSTYDVASDIKINGWSEIAGFGNIHEVKDGRLAWGVFYENGTGNYRTWNTFNNEMFRGDGSLLYNGGGAAVRLTKDSGMYYEASLRAGTLSSSMSNAVKDGNGNSYGFDSDSTYWGAHVGAGKLIQRGSGQWDIYGKYFHTDIDGDSFEMGGDRFSFDDVTSDRLRLGARYTADTDKAWSLYCGAAYEYEFSGDSRMKAGQFEAPEQSLQGSTVFGEIGTVWGRKDSPWSMDVNLRGYAGEREGFSGMVQLAYAF